MPSPTLPPEDLPPPITSDVDAALRRQLELSTRQHFFEACDGMTQSLLMACGWTISIAEVLMLVIHCPDQQKNWQVLNHITVLADRLAQFGTHAKIRVYPPSSLVNPFDFRVAERTDIVDR